MGRDYPLGYEYFRSRCYRVFLKNSKETDPAKIDQMIKHGEFVIKELEALYMLKKYRTLKSRYYSAEDNAKFDELMLKINKMAQN
ncbi:UNVERIFIED_CONTAM: hypothetical protein PYX00_009830 [Menopon gallinae]|uniref:LYR motif-containing protein 5 n=1 Tax=Menopon gallinae TaxID=328185 RepID=A0AAW2HDL1_9NEOP